MGSGGYASYPRRVELDLHNAVRTSPLFQELAKALDAGPSLPESNVKRQHFIPQFQLRRFGRASDGRLLQLAVRQGQPRWVTVRDAASRHRYYTLEGEDGERHNRVEAYLSLVEGHAAPAIERYLADPTGISGGDAMTIAMFIALLDARTPGATARSAAVADTNMRLMLASQVADLERFTVEHRERHPDATDEEIADLRDRMLRGLRDGTIAFPDEKRTGLDYAFRATGDTSQLIFQLRWTLLRATEGEFITSDRGLAMYDPFPQNPWTGNGWISSDNAQTTIPLAPDACLLLTPKEPGRAVMEVDQAAVDGVNLRTYGWAVDHIFGGSQEVATRTRRHAKKIAGRLPRPVPSKQVMLIEADPDDESLARANAARGWPPWLPVEGRPHDYVVVESGTNAVDQQVRLTQLAARRARKRGAAMGSGPVVHHVPGEQIGL